MVRGISRMQSASLQLDIRLVDPEIQGCSAHALALLRLSEHYFKYEKPFLRGFGLGMFRNGGDDA